MDKFNWDKILQPSTVVKTNSIEEANKLIRSQPGYNRLEFCTDESKNTFPFYHDFYNGLGWDIYAWENQNITILNYEDVLMEEYKTGEEVEVKDNNHNLWNKRIFLFKYNNKFHCISNTTMKCANSRCGYTVVQWDNIRKPLPTIDISITINGKKAKLSNISEETLLKLRNEN